MPDLTPWERWCYDHLPVGIAILDRQRVYQYVNATYAATQGFYAPDLQAVAFTQGPAYWVTLLTPLFEQAEANHDLVSVYDVTLIYPGQPKLQRQWDVTVLPYRNENTVDGFLLYLTDVTCREQLRQLGTETARLHSVFDVAVDTILVIDDGGIIINANPAACRMFGYTADELIGLSLPTLMPEDRRQEHRYGMERYLHTGVPHVISTVYDVEARRKDGSAFPCELSVAESQESGERRIFVGILRDVTERRRGEEALRASESSYRQLFEDASDAIMLFDDAGHLLNVNRQAERLTNYFEHELLQMSMDGLIQHDQRDAIRVCFDSLRQHGSIAGDTLLQRCDGAVIEVEYRGVRIAPNRYQIILRDVTERKRAEAERDRLFAEIEQRAGELDSILNSIADGLVIYNVNGDILRINEAARQILGYSPVELQLPVSERFAILRAETPDGIPFPYEMFPTVNATRGNTVFGVVMVLHHPPENTVWVVSSAAPIRTPDGTLLGAVATFTDITARRALEEEREIYIHTISHDLRIPLAVIQGHAQVLQDVLEQACQTEETRISTDAIIDGVRRMNLLIKDLVDTARLESKQLQLSLQPVALEPYLHVLLDRIAQVMTVSRVALDIVPELPLVMADPDRVDRIFINLLTNALKYSAADTPVVIRIQRTDPTVTISVIDCGTGIAPDEIPHLFERFYRVREVHTTEGIGLGLYIVKMLVEAHGGRIWVESKVGTGSTFAFTMPIVVSE